MTIEQAKDQAAQEITYKSWNEAVSFPSYGAYTVAAMAHKAMIIYADAKAKEAYNQAIYDAAESAEVEKEETGGLSLKIIVKKQSILKLLK